MGGGIFRVERVHGEINLNSLKEAISGIIEVTTLGVIKEDARSVDSSSYRDIGENI